jgi:hypothetical protein
MFLPDTSAVSGIPVYLPAPATPLALPTQPPDHERVLAPLAQTRPRDLAVGASRRHDARPKPMWLCEPITPLSLANSPQPWRQTCAGD